MRDLTKSNLLFDVKISITKLLALYGYDATELEILQTIRKHILPEIARKAKSGIGVKKCDDCGSYISLTERIAVEELSVIMFCENPKCGKAHRAYFL